MVEKSSFSLDSGHILLLWSLLLCVISTSKWYLSQDTDSEYGEQGEHAPWNPVHDMD